MSGVLESGITLADWAYDVTRKTNGVRARAEAVPTRHKDGFRRSVAGSPTETQKGAVRGVEDVSTSSGAERENRTGVWPAYGRWKTNCCVGC